MVDTTAQLFRAVYRLAEDLGEQKSPGCDNNHLSCVIFY